MSDRVIAYTDGGSRGNPGPAAAGIVLLDSHHQCLLAQGFFLGDNTNNVAEYTGVIKACQAARRHQAQSLELFSDSELLVKQLNGQYRVRSALLKPLYDQALTLLHGFKDWKVTHVPRNANAHADRLVNKALNAGKDIVEKVEHPLGREHPLGAMDPPKQPHAKPLKLGGLISGGGRTILNILDQIRQGQLHAEIPLAISSRSNVSGVQRLRDAGLTVKIVRKKDHPDIESFSHAIETAMTGANVDLIIQGGWLCLWKIPQRFRYRVMNIHPALLPSFGGQGMWGDYVHEAVLKAGCKVSGCTVHFCTDEYDVGPIIVQRTCPVEEDDTVDTLAARVFEQECLAYPEAINLFAQERLIVKGSIAHIKS